MIEVIIHTGFVGDITPIKVSWYDHDNIRYEDTVVVPMEPEDKPRTLTITIGGKVVYRRNNHGKIYT